LQRFVATLWWVIWTVVGGIMLWRDNSDYEPRDFHNVLMASVIIHMIMLWTLKVAKPSSSSSS
jgi:hypothetical protein